MRFSSFSSIQNSRYVNDSMVVSFADWNLSPRTSIRLDPSSVPVLGYRSFMNSTVLFLSPPPGCVSPASLYYLMIHHGNNLTSIPIPGSNSLGSTLPTVPDFYPVSVPVFERRSVDPLIDVIDRFHSGTLAGYPSPEAVFVYRPRMDEGIPGYPRVPRHGWYHPTKVLIYIDESDSPIWLH